LITLSSTVILSDVLIAGFGLGALNDADEDDLDVYDSGGMQKNKMAYDIESDSEDKILIGSRKTRPKGPSSIVGNSPL
jgi:G patch domain-containing protein 1